MFFAIERDRVEVVDHVAQVSRRAVDTLCDAGGASAHFLDNPLQRARRDVNCMTGHMVFDTDARLRSHGRALLGMPSESRWH